MASSTNCSLFTFISARCVPCYCHDVLPSVCLSVWDGRALWSYGAI